MKLSRSLAKHFRKFLIWTGIWGRIYPPMNIGGIFVHRPWPWNRPIPIDEIVASNPMTQPNNETVLQWSEIQWPDNPDSQ